MLGVAIATTFASLTSQCSNIEIWAGGHSDRTNLLTDALRSERARWKAGRTGNCTYVIRILSDLEEVKGNPLFNSYHIEVQRGKNGNVRFKLNGECYYQEPQLCARTIYSDIGAYLLQLK